MINITQGAHEATFPLSSNKYVAKIAALKLKLWPAELLLLKAEGVGIDQELVFTSSIIIQFLILHAGQGSVLSSILPSKSFLCSS